MRIKIKLIKGFRLHIIILVICMKKVFLFLIIFLISFRVFAAVDLAKNSKSAILIESTTGKILYEKNSGEKRSPASMTKMMTLLLATEALDSGKIKLDDMVHISKNASSMGGTQIFLEENSEISVETLLKGISIASANDAAVAIGEFVGGTIENFVSMMNNRCIELGCKNTSFKNPHGLDEDGHLTTAYDMSVISRELVKHDSVLKLTSTYEDNISVSGENHWLVNTNKLIRFYKGVDGLKTGYTDNAGYCLTATMNKNNMRLISVVMGSDTKDNRSSDTIGLLEYGYSMYGSNTIINKDEFYGTIHVENAKVRKVKYYLDTDINLIVDKNVKDVNYKTDIELFKVKAPLKKNSKVGILKLYYEDNMYTYDLVIHDDIKKTNYFEVFYSLLKDVFSGDK